MNLEKFKQTGGKQMLKEQMKAAVETGKYPLPRKEGSAHEMCQEECFSTVA